MKEIKKYLIESLKVTDVVADLLLSKFANHHDICDELCECLKNKSYEVENPVVINGYTAHEISKLNTKFDVMGVYSFMITLREEPQKAEAYIKDSFSTL